MTTPLVDAENLSDDWQDVSRKSSDADGTLVTELHEREFARLVVALYEHQLRYGCGNDSCANQLCSSCRRKEAIRPPREYTATSARAMAYHLATMPDPESRLCRYLIDKFLRRDGEKVEMVLEALRQAEKSQETKTLRRDTKSFAQQLFSTRATERFATVTGEEYRYRQAEKAPSDIPTIVLRIIHSIRELTEHVTVNNGQVILSSVPVKNTTLKLANTLHKLSKAVTAEGKLLCSILSKELCGLGPRLVVLDAMMQDLFVLGWDGGALIPAEAAITDALMAMLFIRQAEPAIGDQQALHVNHIARQAVVDPMSFVLSFIPCLDTTLNPSGVCLTAYPFLLPQSHQITIFRGLCFYRMCDAVDTSRLYRKILQKCFVPLAVDRFWPPEVTSLQTGALSRAFSLYLTIQVRREQILSDTMDQLWRRQKRELLRPLRVRIVSEAEVGVDQGGIAQEFFRLAFIEAFDPAYGLFTVDERTRFAWFDINCMEPVFKYEILGVVMALAIHNGFTLPVTFPEALYRKLLGLPVDSLEHIADGWPELTHGLTQLRDWEDGDVADVFLRTYEFSYERLGATVTYNMMTPNHQHTPEANATPPMVTNANRNAYIKAYIKHLTMFSVLPALTAFARGFHTILPPTVLTTTTPSTLKLLAEGLTQDIDTHALERITRYSNGYCADTPYIKSFWAMVHAWPQQRKQQLLEFVTASDRVPVNGISSIPFLIQRHGGGASEERLPTSVTCFGRLLLPEYRDEATMRRKVQVALENARGFGLS